MAKKRHRPQADKMMRPKFDKGTLRGGFPGFDNDEPEEKPKKPEPKGTQEDEPTGNDE